jgi:hypothetical protein
MRLKKYDKHRREIREVFSDSSLFAIQTLRVTGHVRSSNENSVGRSHIGSSEGVSGSCSLRFFFD